MSAGRVCLGLGAFPHPPRRAVVTVGVFDGVHTAHQQLIRTTVRFARRIQGTSVVITFDPDPQTVLDPAHAQPALMPIEERLTHLAVQGADWIWVIPFTRRFAKTRPEDFVRRILLRRLRAVALVIGETFLFGRDRRGNIRMLRMLGAAHGMRIAAVRPIRSGAARVSSSRIRRLIARGQLAQARALLGRPAALYGTVVPGAGRGRHLGFPTVNIRLIPQVIPPQGVYAVTVSAAHARRTWHGVMNLGVRPTFGPGPLVCEVHLVGFSGTLLGRAVRVSLMARLRGERCFPDPAALCRQVQRDLACARRLFARPAA